MRWACRSSERRPSTLSVVDSGDDGKPKSVLSKRDSPATKAFDEIVDKIVAVSRENEQKRKK